MDKVQQEKGTKEQFKKMLLNNGAKQAEMDWMGFDELPEKLTKTDIQNWIEENRIEVQEVVIDDIKKFDLEIKRSSFGTWDVIHPAKGVINSSRTEALARHWIDNYAPKEITGKDTRFSQYVLPGGENYRELLLTLPKIKEAEEFKQFHTSDYYADAPILAHIRFDERTVNDERVLFIEELQSDWQQSGRERGFKGDTTYDAVLEKENVWNVGGVKVLYFERGVDGKNYRTIPCFAP